jgi:malonate-semialdehyde dehydrogenase (acetylating)/methylmalonate-semialdehyde dehydrogenase
MTGLKAPTQNPESLKLLAGGRWVDSSSQDAHPTFDPGTGTAIAMVPFATREEVSMVVESAQEAFDDWRKVPITERVRFIFKMKEALEKHAEELATINTRNHGKTLEESRGDVMRALENVDTAIAAAYTLAKGETLDEVSRDVDVQLEKEPLGVFSIVCPFNFPLMIPFWFIPYAIVLGDTVVVKPSELTPVPMQMAAQFIQDEVGLPPGVLNIVHGGKDVVEALIAHKNTKGVTFVGSTPVAKEVYRLAGQHGKRAVVNGGAKNSVVVQPDADLSRFMPSIVSSFFGNTGQRCLAGSNLLTVGKAHESALMKFVEAASRMKVGYGLEEGIQMGPLVSQSARARVQRHIETAANEGAKIVSDGRTVKVAEHPDGFYLGASVLDGVDPSMTVAKEEVFGPLASVIQNESLDDAIDVINKGTGFGNMACIYTTSGRSAREFRRRANVGNVGVNIGVAAPPAFFPFGGRGDSFYGILHAQVDTVDFFTDKKVTIYRW